MKVFVHAMTVVLLNAMSAGAICAQTYPAKSMRLILPSPPGGPTDLLGRQVAQKLAEQMGQPMVPENRPGAGGNLGAELAAKAPADGYTLVLSANVLAISPHLYRKLNYDLISSTPERFGEFIKSETARYGKVIREAKLEVQP